MLISGMPAGASPMRLPRFFSSLGWQMVLVVLAALECGLGSFLYHYHETYQGFGDLDPWSAAIIQLGYLNLVILGPPGLLAWAIRSRAGTSGETRADDKSIPPKSERTPGT